MIGAAPSRLNTSPPGSNLGTNLREHEIVASVWLVSILKILADLRRPVLSTEIRALHQVRNEVWEDMDKVTYHFCELKPSLLLDVSLEEVLPCRTSSGGGDVLPSILLREPISEGVLIGVELGESTVGPALVILRRPFDAGVGLL